MRSRSQGSGANEEEEEEEFAIWTQPSADVTLQHLRLLNKPTESHIGIRRFLSISQRDYRSELVHKLCYLPRSTAERLSWIPAASVPQAPRVAVLVQSRLKALLDDKGFVEGKVARLVVLVELFEGGTKSLQSVGGPPTEEGQPA